MKIRILFGALLIVLFCTGISTSADAQHKRKWNSDDSRVYVQPQDNDHVVYDGDRVISVRHYHERGDGRCRRCYDDNYSYDYKEERRYYRHRNRYDRFERDEYYNEHQKNFHYRADYTHDNPNDEYRKERHKNRRYSADYTRDE